MNCKKCGNILNETDVFCRNCGEKVINETSVNTQINTNGVIGQETPQINPNASIFGTATIKNNMEYKTPEPVINTEATPQVTTPNINNTSTPTIPIAPSPMIANIPKKPSQVEPNVTPISNPTPVTSSVPTEENKLNQTSSETNELLNQPLDSQPINNPINQPLNNLESNSINQAPVTNNSLNNKQDNQRKIFVLAGISLGLLIVGIIVLVVFIFSDKKEVNVDTDNNDSRAVQPNSNSNSNTIEYNNYKFSFFEGYMATLSGTDLQVVNNNDKIAFVINISTQNVPLATVITQKELLRSSLTQQNISVTDIIQKTYNNKDFLIIKATQDGQNVDFAMTEIEAGKTIQIGVINSGISSEERIYQDLVNVLNSAQKKSSGLTTDDTQSNENFRIEKFNFKFEE